MPCRNSSHAQSDHCPQSGCRCPDSNVSCRSATPHRSLPDCTRCARNQAAVIAKHCRCLPFGAPQATATHSHTRSHTHTRIRTHTRKPYWLRGVRSTHSFAQTQPPETTWHSSRHFPARLALRLRATPHRRGISCRGLPFPSLLAQENYASHNNTRVSLEDIPS